MKTILLFSLFVFMFKNSGFSQTVNGFPLSEVREEYLEISGFPVILKSTRINLYINFGQKLKGMGNSEKIVLDNAGKKMEFNSIIEGLNFMNNYGYELVQTYGTEPVFFLMRKKKKD